MTKIVYCQSTWREDFEDTKLCIERVSPHVDATVIAFDDTLTEEQIHWLMVNSDPYRLHPVRFKWEDDMPAMRNVYLNKAKELKANWVVVSDPDELFSEELAENLRRLIEEHNILGYNLLPVHAVDQFENVEWLDDLDLLKETPGGYRETDFWKPLLIFKVYQDTHYEGVGVEKNVHEMLKSETPWKPKNLPKKYHYVHRKSALRIWRNAARNMFISGGGDNVGTINPHWPKLRAILRGLAITTWEDFEKFVKHGTENPDFHDWLFEALQAPPTNWGTETREAAKWYFTFHNDQITPEIRESLENPPKMTPEIELENFVTRCYFEVLGRHPDEHGKNQYVQALSAGLIKREQLPTILRQSPEFKQRFGEVPPGPVESIPLQVPVDVNVRISEGIFLEALKKSGIYWGVIKPKIDVGGFILGALRKKDEFLMWFYANKEDLTIQDLTDWIRDNAPKPNSVALCIMGYRKVLPMISESISVMSPYVDEIHVQGDDFNEGDITYLEAKGASVHIEPWLDEFSDYKNKCIDPANTEWVLICDHDEIPTPDLAENLRDIIKKSDRGSKYNMVQFDVIDVDTKSGKPISENRSPSGKALLHWNIPNPYYGNPHIWLKPNYYPWKLIHASYAYRHVKEIGTELPRSVRNVFLGGGGDNTREGNPLWIELRRIATELKLDTWRKFDAYLRKGGINQRLLDVMKKLSEMPWKDTELQDPLRYYYLLHPEESITEDPERVLDLIGSGEEQHNWEKHYKLKEGDTFVEGGPFWGRYVRKASKKVGPTGQIIAIEPSPENIRMLKVLTKTEGLKNVTIVEKALWSEPGRELLFIQEHPASHQLKRLPLVKTGEMPSEDAEYVEVGLDTVENILSGLGIDHVELLSADIEGAELAMLKGCGKYLDEKRIRNIAVAVYHIPTPKGEEFISILRGKGYEVSLEDEGIVYAHLREAEVVRGLPSEHFNPAVDGEFFKLARSVPGSPGTFSSSCPEHQWEGRYRLRPGDTFVEAGAFWGRYGLIASKRVGPGGRVILIEGDPRNTDMIERVIKHYSLSNVTLVKGIVWSKDEYTKMCVGDNPAASRRALDGDVDVRAYTLDTLLPELGVQNVDLLACDVEGAEVEMVLGADRYLGEGRIRNVALAAYHQAGFPERIMDFLRERGFVDLFYSYDLPQFGTIVYGRSQK